MSGQLPHHVEPAVLVEEEVLEDDWTNQNLHLSLRDQIIDDSVHESELLTGDLVSILHSNDDVAPRSSKDKFKKYFTVLMLEVIPENSEQFWQG